MLPSCHSARRACMPEVAGFTLDQESSVLGFCDFAFRLCAEWQHFERFPESRFWRLRSNSQMHPSCHSARRACMPEVAESTLCPRILSTWILRLRFSAQRRMTVFWEASWIQVLTSEKQLSNASFLSFCTKDMHAWSCRVDCMFKNPHHLDSATQPYGSTQNYSFWKWQRF